MYLRYGTYNHANNSVRIAIVKDVMLSESGVRRGIMERWDIDGMLLGDDAAELTGRILTIESVYADDAKDLRLYEDDGTAAAHFLLSRKCRGGTRVVRRPSFPKGDGAEYATMRNYSVAVEGELADVGGTLLHYREALNWTGSLGVDWGYLVPLNGPPQPQLFTQQTLQTVIQEGFAVGSGSYPTPPGPIWPEQEIGKQRRIRMEIPSRFTNERRISWTYVHVSPTELPGVPSVR
jgi:hypothetical protein